MVEGLRMLNDALSLILFAFLMFCFVSLFMRGDK